MPKPHTGTVVDKAVADFRSATSAPDLRPYLFFALATMLPNRLVAISLLMALTPVPAASQSATGARSRPEIIRTAFGVPHIYAADHWAAGYGLAWVQLEDYGSRVVQGLIGARGRLARIYGRDSIDSDFLRQPIHELARERWLLLRGETRSMYEGFAAAVNDYLRANPDLVAPGVGADFVGWDVLAREIGFTSPAAARRLIRRTLGAPPAPAPRSNGDVEGPDDGSNAWALAPSRTRSGKAILLRNPHLDWNAGYYEAQLVIPGVLDFYGDFRIGTAFAVVGGFNRHLGWATTNNAVDNDEVYSVELAPGLTDQILLDGRPVPLTRRLVTVEYRNGAAFSTETRETWRSPLGPVIERLDGKAYLLKAAGDGEHRGGEQFLAMMTARSYAEWRAALAIRARATSNLTYADRAGNVFYIWNGALPALPHPPGGDTTIVAVSRTSEVWSGLVPLDSLPQVLNPPGGYVHNENSSPHFTSLEAPLDPARLPPNVEPPSFSLRSQLGVDLIGRTGRKLTLEDVVALKHSYRMLLAERIKPELVAAARRDTSARVRAAVELLGRWDNTAAADARGAVLFETWWRLYAGRGAAAFAEPWSFEEPTTTPRGLADPSAAVAALATAADSVVSRWGALDVAWGEVHRIRIAGQDLPVGGCHGNLGCFRVLWFRDEPDGKRAVQGGDGWVLAVEFGDRPKAYSVLAYGQSNRDGSPWHADQAAMFARGELKRVALTREEVEHQAVRRYVAGSP